MTASTTGPSLSRSSWVLARSSGTSRRSPNGWKTAWHPDDPARWGDLNIRRTLCWQGTHQCSAFFCALRNLSDCARLEMLQTDFRREMGCSGSFASVRGLPRNGRRVISRVFLDDFGKIVRSRSLKCVRVWSRLSPSPFLQHPDLYRVVQNPLNRNGSGSI